MLSRAKEFVRPLIYFRSLVLVCSLFSFALVALEGVSTALVIPLLEGLVNGRDFQWSGISVSLPGICALILFAVIVKVLIRTVSSWYSAKLHHAVLRRLRLQIMRRIYQSPLEMFQRHNNGRLIALYASHAYYYTYALDSIMGIAQSVLIAIVFIACLMVLSWQMTMLAAAFGLVGILLTRWSSGRVFQRMNLTRREEEGLYNALSEDLGGAVQTRIYNDEKRRLKTHAKKADVMAEHFAWAQCLHEVARGGTEAFYATVLLGGLIVLNLYYADKLMAWAGMMLSFVFILFRLRGQIERSLRYVESFIENYPHSRALLDFLSAERPESKAAAKPTDAILLQGVGMAIADERIFSGIDATLRRGEVVGVAGPVGAGKSTLAYVLAGLTEPTAGQLSLYYQGKRHIGSIKTGFVGQEFCVYRESVQDAVVMGRTYDKTRLEKVLRQVGLEEFCGGSDDEIGEGARLLSQGEKQRLSLARALYESVDLLILDEVGSAQEEAGLPDLMQRVLQDRADRITVVISHRTECLAACDRILHLEKVEAKNLVSRTVETREKVL